MTAPHRIDVHHHILPREYVSALARTGIIGGGGIPFPRWSVEDALGVMERHGIQAAVTSISSPGVHFGDAVAARELARRCNEICARLVTRLTVDGLTAYDDFDEAARGAIERDNALVLLPRLRDRIGGGRDA